MKQLNLFLLSFLFLSIRLVAQDLDSNAFMDKVYAAYELEGIDNDSAYSLAEEALTEANQFDYKLGKAYALVRLASINNLQGKNDSAIHFAQEARAIRIQEGDLSGAIGVCYILAYAFEETGNVDSAFAVLYDAKRMIDAAGDSSDLVDVLLELGNLNASYKEAEEALELYVEAGELAKRIDYQAGQATANSNRGRAAFAARRFEEAIGFYLDAQEYYLKEQDQVALALNYNNLALAHSHLEHYQMATLLFNNAIQLFKDLGMNAEQANSYFNLGSMYNNRRMPDSAIFFLNKSKFMSHVIGDIMLLAKSHEFLADAYVMNGDYLLAYENQVQSNRLQDSVLSIEKVKSISDMQTKYETEKKEQKIVLLDAQNKTKSAQRNVLLVGSLLLLLIILASSIYWRQKNKLAKKNKEIAEQKIESLLDEQEIKTYDAMLAGQEEERLRIATDLHDRLGSMLSTIKLLFSSLEEKIDLAQEESKKQADRAGNLIDDACVEVRRISHNLGSGMVANFGLIAALDNLCSSIQSSGKISCEFIPYGDFKGLPLQTEVEIYRMIQEGINNSLKHSQAENLSLQINRLSDEININLSDDGIGFDKSKVNLKGGMGLGSLQTRADKIKANLIIDSKIGSGTNILIEIPLS